VAGAGRPEPTCGIWAIVEDERSGNLWLQGPAMVREAGWELDLVLGTGEPAVDSLRYRLSLVVAAPSLHEPWHRMARQPNAVRLSDRPRDAAWLARDRPVELRRSADAITIVEVADSH
jgi:hypothetical protein